MREKRESRARSRRRVKTIKLPPQSVGIRTGPTTGHYGRLTTRTLKPSILSEQATSSYSFRSSELSQPI